MSKLFLGCVILKRGSDESLMRLCSSREEDNAKVKYMVAFVLQEKKDFSTMWINKCGFALI